MHRYTIKYNPIKLMFIILKVDVDYISRKRLDQEEDLLKQFSEFLNVRQDLIPDNIETNKIVLTTYNVLFKGPMYNYAMKLAEDKKNILIIVGRP